MKQSEHNYTEMIHQEKITPISSKSGVTRLELILSRGKKHRGKKKRKEEREK